MARISVSMLRILRCRIKSIGTSCPCLSGLFKIGTPFFTRQSSPQHLSNPCPPDRGSATIFRTKVTTTKQLLRPVTAKKMRTEFSSGGSDTRSEPQRRAEILPDVFFRRSRNQIEVSWGHTRVEGAPRDLRFLAPAGHALLEPKQTAHCLYKAIKQAVDELCERVPNNPRLSSLHTEVNQLSEPRSFLRAAWIAGIGKSTEESEAILLRLGNKLAQKYKELIIPAPEELVISHAPAAVLMFGSLSPNVEEHDVQALLALLKDTVGIGREADRLPLIKYEAMRSSAWQQGYLLANLARKEMGVSETLYKVDLDKLFSRNGIRKREVDLSDIKIRAVAICGQGLHPVVAFNKSSKHNESEPGLRFTLAHELCHLLFDEEEGVPLAVASGPWAPAEIEKRANAFAAMFLMPENACRMLLDSHSKNGKVNQKVISTIAAIFGTSKLATLRHLGNLGLIDNDEVSFVEEELTN